MDSSGTFSNIRFKKETAQRFQTFSRTFFKTHTEALHTMLDFFKYNEISPHEKLGPRMTLIMEFLKHMKRYLGNRNDAAIAVMRGIEREGVMPTKAMIELLFERAPPKEDGPELIEIGNEDTRDQGNYSDSLEAIDLRKEKNVLKQELDDTRKRFDDILYSKIRETRPSFGRPRLYLDMAPEEFNTLKETFKNR